MPRAKPVLRLFQCFFHGRLLFYVVLVCLHQPIYEQIYKKFLQVVPNEEFFIGKQYVRGKEQKFCFPMQSFLVAYLGDWVSLFF